jgi:hypothetical protein
MDAEMRTDTGTVTGLADRKGIPMSRDSPLTWDSWLRHPWNDAVQNPGIATTALVAVWHLIVVIFFNIVVIYSLGSALAVTGVNVAFAGFISALVQASLYYAFVHITPFERYLPTYIFPEMAWVEALSMTRTMSLLAVVYYTVLTVGGAALAGVLLVWIGAFVPNIANNVVTPSGLTNVLLPTNQSFVPAGFAFYCVGIFVLSLVWVYTKTVSSHDEKHQEHNLHRRASKATAIILFVLVLAFQSLGIRYYSVSTYIASGIYTTYWEIVGYNGSPVTWAIFIFLPMVMTLAAAVVYVIMNKVITATYKGGSAPALPPYEDAAMETKAKIGYTSSRLKDRIHVEY